MRIAIDISQLNEKRTGIENYIFNIANEAAKDSKNQVFLLTSKETHKHVFPNNKLIVLPAKKTGIVWAFRASKVLKQNKIDILISTALFSLPIFFWPTAQIIYDIEPIIHPAFWPKLAVLKFKTLIRIAVKKSSKILTISKFTQQKLIENFPAVEEKSFVISTGLQEWAYRSPTEEQLISAQEALNLPQKYVLSVSTLQPRKNYENMLRAFAIFSKENPEYYYVISGKKGWFYNQIFELTQELGITNKVVFLGYVDDKYIQALYYKSKALLYCSFGEGFGMPPLEAYAQGVPVILSKIEVLQETMAKRALFVNPHSPEDISSAIIKAIKLKEKPDSAFLEQFSWGNIYRNIVKSIDIVEPLE